MLHDVEYAKHSPEKCERCIVARGSEVHHSRVDVLKVIIILTKHIPTIIASRLPTIASSTAATVKSCIHQRTCSTRAGLRVALCGFGFRVLGFGLKLPFIFPHFCQVDFPLLAANNPKPSTRSPSRGQARSDPKSNTKRDCLQNCRSCAYTRTVLASTLHFSTTKKPHAWDHV